MKLETILTTSQIRDFFRGFSSNRCAAYVADMLKLGAPASRGAKEHLSGNAGQPSQRAKELLEWAGKVGAFGLEVRVLQASEDALDENTHANLAEIEWGEIYALKLCNKEEHESLMVKLAQETADWWENEGKHECLAEEQGTFKEYLYECDRAEQFGRTRPHVSEFFK